MAAQFRQKTRAELRRQVVQLMHRDKFVYGTVLASPAPTATTFCIAEARRFPSGTFKGTVAYAVSGTGAGQSSYVEDSEAGTGEFTLAPALATTFDATTVVEIMPESLNPSAVDNALNLALQTVTDQVNVYTETLSPTIPDAERRTVTIPADYVKLVDFRYIDAGGQWVVFRFRHNADLPQQEQYRDFTIRGNTIYLSEPIPSDTTVYVISGYTLPDELDADDDVAEAPPAFLTYWAAANLEQSLSGNADADPEGHGQRGATWMAQAQALKPGDDFTRYKPNTVRLD